MNGARDGLALAERQRAALRICFDPEPAQADLQALGTPERWMVYRRLVRDRLHKMLRAGLPRTADAVGDAAFDGLFARWLASSPPRTHYIRDVVPEFTAYARPHWRDASPATPWAADLADYECARWQATLDDDRVEAEIDEFAFERIPVLNPTAHLLRLEYPVHEAQPTTGGYEQRPTRLCVYRPPGKLKAATWKLNDFAADLAEAWQDGQRTATETVQAVAQSRGVAIDQTLVDKLGAMLADFLERGILLGSRK